MLALLFMLLVIALGGRGVYVRSAYAKERVHTRAHELDFTISEVADARGLTAIHTVDELPNEMRIGPWVQSLGSSVSVADVNGDSYMDIYVPSGRFNGLNQLFINDGSGHFNERAAQFGLADLNRASVSIRSIFFDVNNDGRQDLLLATTACPMILLQGSDAKFTLVENSFPATACQVNEAIGLTDLDGDGRLDMIVGGIPFDLQALRVLPENVVDAANGTKLTALLNAGDGRFIPADEKIDDPGRFFYHSIGMGDLRGTGRPDLWVSTDFNSDKIFFHNGSRLESVSPPFSNSKSGMNSEVMYLRDQKLPFVFVTHVFHLGYGVGGNNLWQWDGSKFRDSSVSRGLHECGWSWGGRSLDLNNDGLLDLAVVNGFISGNPNDDYWFTFGVLISSSKDILRDFRFWPPMNGKDFSGHERDCLYVNRGDHFENVAETVDFDASKLDGRGVAVIDPDNSGHQHLVVANQKGKLAYYEITPKRPNAWIGFSVTSLKGARDAVGTRVIVRAGGHTYTREAYTLNTFAAQSDPRLHVGLGSTTAVDAVEVRWPNGETQSLGPMSVNAYHHLTQE